MAPREFQDSVRKFISVHPDGIYGLGSGFQCKSVKIMSGLRTGQHLSMLVRKNHARITYWTEVFNLSP